jgi:hypothetical protein
MVGSGMAREPEVLDQGCQVTFLSLIGVGRVEWLGDGFEGFFSG